MPDFEPEKLAEIYGKKYGPNMKKMIEEYVNTHDQLSKNKEVIDHLKKIDRLKNHLAEIKKAKEFLKKIPPGFKPEDAKVAMDFLKSIHTNLEGFGRSTQVEEIKQEPVSQPVVSGDVYTAAGIVSQLPLSEQEKINVIPKVASLLHNLKVLTSK